MNILKIFKNKYKCRRCFSTFYKDQADAHYATLCPDNRRFWGIQIIKKDKKYLVQGKYYFSTGFGIMPIFYWDTLEEFTTLTKARQYKNKVLEENNQRIIE